MKTLRVLLVLAFVFTIIPGAQAFEKTTLIEYFTNVNCGPCAGQHPFVQDMLNTYTRDQVSFIVYHTNWPSSTDGYYLGNVAENTGRWSYYGVNYVPWFQGEGIYGDSSQLTPILNQVVPRIGDYTPYNIEFGPFEQVGNTVPMTVTLTCAEATPNNNMRFNIVLVDKMQVIPPGSNGIDDYRYNMLDMAYGYQGQAFTSPGGNEELVFNYTFNIPDNNFFNNLAMYAFVQDYGTREIFQCAYTSTPEVIISGQVTRAINGDPIAGAEVALNGGVDGTAVTNADGNYAFFGLDEANYEITVSMDNYVDITLPSQLYQYGTHTLDFSMESVCVDLPMVGAFTLESGAGYGGVISGNYGYFAQGSAGLQIIDVSDPANMTTVGSTSINQTAKDVILNGSAAYVATTSGYKVVNVSDPANPTPGSGMNFGDTGGMVMAANYVFAASATNGLIVLNANNPLNPQYVTMFATSGAASDLAISGTYAFIAIDDNGLAVVNVSNPANPSLVTELDLGAASNAIDIAGNTAYVALSTSGFAVVDISDPANPVLVNTFAAGGNIEQLKVVDNVLFVANYFNGFRAYDVSNPNNISELGYCLTPEASNHVTVDGDVVYGSDAGYIYSLDGSAFLGGNNDPVTLTLVGTQTEIPAGGGTVMYDATIQSMLGMTVPGCSYKTYVQLPNGSTVGPTFNQGFTLIPFMNVTVTDLTQAIPGNAPSGTYNFIGTISRQGVPQVVTDSFNFTKLAAGTDGEFVYDPSEWQAGGSFDIAGDVGQVFTPNNFEMTAAYPNPFNPTTALSVNLPETANLTVAVYNITGERVAELANGRYAAGTHQLVFDASGLASGVYFVHAAVPGHLNTVQKVMLVQ